jgi:hypothetical protein
MKAREMVNELQSQIKEQICNILVNRYKELHDGQLPNWEDDEDIVLTYNEISEDKVFYLNVDSYNTYDDFKEVERITIIRYFVTLDYNLFFEDENENEIEWTEVNIYNLADLLDGLNKIFN